MEVWTKSILHRFIKGSNSFWHAKRCYNEFGPQ